MIRYGEVMDAAGVANGVVERRQMVVRAVRDVRDALIDAVVVSNSLAIRLRCGFGLIDGQRKRLEYQRVTLV